MIPTVQENLFARFAHRVQLRFREAGGATAALDGTASPLHAWPLNDDSDRFTITSTSGTIGALLALSALVLVLYGQILWSMAQQWWSDPNYGHGFLVPVFAAYVLWRERDRTRGIPAQPSPWGVSIMVAAIGLLILGTLGAEHFTARVSFIVLISGMIVFFAGWRALRSMSFPIGYLIFMIPLPAIVYYQMTFPLQLLASRMGASGLVALGVPTVREGNLLILPNITLEVVEACSGVRSLLSLLAAVVGYVHLAEPIFWKRCLLVASTVPIVILSNGLRLIASGELSFHYGASADSGFPHAVLGLICFAIAFLSILVLHRLLRRGEVKSIPAPVH